MILFHSTFDPPEKWLAELGRQLPGDDIRLIEDIDDRSEVDFAIVWDLPVEEFASFPNLRAVLLMGSGGSHLRPVEALPEVPIVRLADQSVARDMAAYALHWVIHFQRGLHLYAEQEPSADWTRHPHVAAHEWTVGILGYGNIGTKVAAACQALGFGVRAWSR